MSSSTPDPPRPSSSSSPTSTPMPPASETIPDRDSSPDLPLTMTASAVLTALPRDATAALAEVSAGFTADDKVVVRFKPVGSAPPVRRELSKISATQRFEAIVGYLRKVLRCRETDSLFLYVNSTFAPALDEVVGNLHRCFKDSNDHLNIAYSLTPAFG